MIDRFEVTRTIPAPAAEIFAVLCDPNGHVSIDASGSLMSAIEAKPVRAVGDRFDLRMDREAIGDLPMGRYEVTVVITGYEQDREIAWTVTGEAVDVPLNHFYGYTLRPADGGTVVTSWYDWSQVPAIWHGREMFGGVIRFPVVPAATLRATLAILERTVMHKQQGLPRE
ncbi:MAG TPA: SRPBCC family protein [Sporichthyaceae bacterium]|jgi:hypothetical protein|nr:SRPBCC family protein [Sporichthyaceae bacterium]